MDMTDAYKRAAAIYNANAEKHVLNETVKEQWIKGSEDFWFIKDIDIQKDGPAEKPENNEKEKNEGKGESKDKDKKKTGSFYTRYIYDKNSLEPLFDHERLAALIAPEWTEKAEKDSLPIEVLEVCGTKGIMYFTVKDVVGEFAYDLEKETLELLRFPLHNKNEVTSPDKKTSLFTKDGNIYSRDNKTGKETQLTFDAEELLRYGSRFGMVSMKLLHEKPPVVMPPAIVWSPNSKYFVTYRTDMRLLGKLHLVQSAPINGDPRPIGVSYPYALPGDEHILEGQVYIGNIETKKVTKVLLNNEAVVLFLLDMFEADSEQVKWTEDGKTLYFVRHDRFFKNTHGLFVDAETSAAKILVEDNYDTFAFNGYFGHASQEFYSETDLRYLPETEEIIWHSETEGWASFYLYDAKTGKVKRRLTQDGWVARRVRFLDKKSRTLYFSGSGKEGGDPYLQSLYKVNLDSGEIEKLTSETAEHVTRFNPSGKYYIDTFSTIQTVPETSVYSNNGEKLLTAAICDISKIIEKGYITPEPFCAVARDGKTPIYGIIIKPYGFDPAKKYPVVDYIYGGSQRINTPKAFEFGKSLEGDPQGGLQSLAQLGFVGIIVDGFATPLREKKIHDYAYGHAEECCGIEDHVCAIKQLAERFPWIDADKAGIWGASGGGYATARALLAFPEFYKVGVSLCGDHDQAKYHAHWGERWQGPYSEEAYHNQANQNFADKLEGHLLLIHGDLDDNVHPSATMKLAEALINANKDFDLLIYPNSNHGVGQFPYVVRRRWDYFVRHLLGETPPKNFFLREPKNKKDKEKK